MVCRSTILPARTTIDLLGITDLHGHISRTTQTDRNTGQTSVEDPGAVTLACEVSAGDSVGGSAYVSSILQDRPTIEVLNAMSLDVSAYSPFRLTTAKSVCCIEIYSAVGKIHSDQ